MTWRELKNFINKQARQSKEFLDEPVNVYNYLTGEQYEADIAELLRDADDEGSGWEPFIAINEKELDNENKSKEASVD